MVKINRGEASVDDLCLFANRIKLLDFMADQAAHVNEVPGDEVGPYCVKILIFDNEDGEGHPELECMINSSNPPPLET